MRERETYLRYAICGWLGTKDDMDRLSAYSKQNVVIWKAVTQYVFPATGSLTPLRQPDRATAAALVLDNVGNDVEAVAVEQLPIFHRV
jgi:hypothetical protein